MLESNEASLDGGRRTRNEPPASQAGLPLISVITVVFNGVKTVEQTIQSVIAQNYPNIEYIIIDGGSVDGTLDILHKYEDQIDYWLSAKDAGIYDAMNKGIALATGDFIGMLNSDDYFATPLAITRIAHRLTETQVDAVFSCLDIVNPVDLTQVLRKYRVAEYSPFMLRIGVMPAHPTFYCKRSCYDLAGRYRTDYRIAADFEMLVRLLIQHHITWSFIDETTVKMRSGGLSSRNIRSNWIVNQEIVRACIDNGLYTNVLMLAMKLPIRLMERIF